LTGTAEVSERTSQGQPAMMREGRVRYLAGWPDPQAFHRILAHRLHRGGDCHP